MSDAAHVLMYGIARAWHSPADRESFAYMIAPMVDEELNRSTDFYEKVIRTPFLALIDLPFARFEWYTVLKTRTNFGKITIATAPNVDALMKLGEIALLA